MKEERLKQYEEWLLKKSAYQMALNIIGIDKQTVAPKAGASYRDQRSAYLAGELFTIETDPKMLEVFDDLLKEDIDGDLRKALELYRKQLQDLNCIPKEEFVAFENLKSQAFEAWLDAKASNDYARFEPYLEKLIETSKQIYGYRASDKNLYDQMLDDYEPGMTMEKYDAFFAKIKERLVPLIQKVTQAKQLNTAFLDQDYPVETQKVFMEQLLDYLRFDSSWGYQNESEHPFTSWTCENDCRITTKYLSDRVISAVLSTVHEVGHAMYEHDIDPKYDGMILSDGVSSGMHESQSRLLENYLGRSLAFWKYHYPKLQSLFSKQLEGISVEEFVKAINESKPSLIRIEADELTYPIHILIRYEIEKGLFNGTISTKELDKTWDDMYEKYLGVRATKSSQGILQDVHWSDASFGYFPTYALGSAISAQFVSKMKQDLDIDYLLEHNQFDEIIAWLKQNIHQYGCRYSADEILTKVTGEPFNPEYYLTYLEDKFTKLYQL